MSPPNHYWISEYEIIICVKLVLKNMSLNKRQIFIRFLGTLRSCVKWIWCFAAQNHVQMIIGDETWVFESTTKRHTSQSSQLKRAWLRKSRVKSMLTIFLCGNFISNLYYLDRLYLTVYLSATQEFKNKQSSCCYVCCAIAQHIMFLKYDNVPSSHIISPFLIFG